MTADHGADLERFYETHSPEQIRKLARSRAVNTPKELTELREGAIDLLLAADGPLGKAALSIQRDTDEMLPGLERRSISKLVERCILHVERGLMGVQEYYQGALVRVENDNALPSATRMKLVEAVRIATTGIRWVFRPAVLSGHAGEFGLTNPASMIVEENLYDVLLSVLKKRVSCPDQEIGRECMLFLLPTLLPLARDAIHAPAFVYAAMASPDDRKVKMEGASYIGIMTEAQFDTALKVLRREPLPKTEKGSDAAHHERLERMAVQVQRLLKTDKKHLAWWAGAPSS
jgi:hypothetical protein